MVNKIPNFLNMLSRSLIFRLLAFFFAFLSGLFILYTQLCSHFSQQLLEETVKASAVRSGDLIKKSLHRYMLTNDRQSLYHTIQVLGDEPGVERIRIYDKLGKIKFSTASSEAGKQLDMKAEACFICHNSTRPSQIIPGKDTARIFTSTDNRRILGLIIPIYNEQQCSNALCHAHAPEKLVLGVLDVQMSLGELDLAAKKSRRRVYSISLIFLTLGLPIVALIIFFSIHKPIKTLRMGTLKLAAGELSYRIKIRRNDELGQLAISFNEMAKNLQEAYEQLKEWSCTLEQRVEEKTRQLEAFHKEMLQMERMASLGKMAATVAHELNNPLASIVNYSKLFEKRLEKLIPETLPQKQELMEDIKLVRSESMRCGNIVKNLLIFARGPAVSFQRARLRDILKRAMDLIEHHCELAGVTARMELETGTEEIICDPEQIIQALVALMINAVEAMPNGGELCVGVTQAPATPEAVRITVTDTGMGIPDELKERIFEPFFSTKTQAKGVGLGLAVVYGIVQRHKGKIWVESSVGKGTTFFIELPMNPGETGTEQKS